MLKFKVLEKGCEPSVANPGDAGIDLRSRILVNLLPGESCAVPLGVKVEIPDGWVGLLFSRSGLGKVGIRLANSVGVVDSGYRGEVCAVIRNDNNIPYTISNFDRVAQLVVVPHYQIPFEIVDELSETVRGVNGFGSSGTK